MKPASNVDHPDSPPEEVLPAKPALTVIIPVYNSAEHLAACLRALADSTVPAAQVIVVDDCSTDASLAVAERSGATVVRMPANGGPAVARNAGAALATGDILVFIDADTELHSDALGIIRRRFAEDSNLDAIFGSYDESPSDPTLVSRFRNLLHCYVHRDAPRQANSFWTGCGAIRRTVFDSVGRFDERIVQCSTEDIELGMRMARLGHRIEIDTSIQVCHLKCWSIGTMIRTDILHRAVPLAELMLREKTYPKVLGVKQLVSVLLLVFLLPWLAGFSHIALAACAILYLGINWRFLRFLEGKGGVRLAVSGLGLLAVHHLCGALGVTLGTLRYIWSKLARKPAAIGVAAALAVAGWQASTVHFNYQNDYTALFCAGNASVLPPDLNRTTYRFAGSPGYDGQFYRLVARDPWLAAGYSRFVDDAAVRWRRILVPAVVWALAAGASERIDLAYVLVVLIAAGLGAYALSRWLILRGRHPAGGLLFLLLPGTLICIDRMTVDVALYTLLFLCLVWDEEGKGLAVWFGLALCGLTRDVGFLVIAAFALAEASALHFRRAAWLLTAALPAAAWYLWVRTTLMHAAASSAAFASPEVPTWAFRQSGYGILLRIMHPPFYHLPPGRAMLALVLDEIALAGMVAGVILTIVYFRRRQAGKMEWVGLLFAALFFVASGEGLWLDLFSWPRAFTPMLAALAFAEAGAARRWLWMPMAAVTLRVGLQFGPQVEGVLHLLRQ